MKRYALLASTAVVGGALAFQTSVNLQGSTPGTAQNGHLNVTGTARAGTVVGYSDTPTGIAFGGDFRSVSTSGRGVLGNASATTGATYGGLFQAFSNGGRGVAGIAQNSAGTTYGGFFSSLSNQGRGVYGQATSASGTTYGVYGKAVSASGYGVYSEGRMHSTGVISGNGSGLSSVNAALLGGLGPSAFLQSIPVPLSLVGGGGTHVIRAQNTNPDSGTAVIGISSAGTGGTAGGYFESGSDEGTGVVGIASTAAANGYTSGVYGQAASSIGRGVFGTAPHTSGANYGVWGETNSTAGTGIYGRSTAATGNTVGVYGQTASNGGTGVWGQATSTSGTTWGVYGQSASSEGYGMFGINTSDSGAAIGGYFQSNSRDAGATGLKGVAAANWSGPTYGVWGENHSEFGYGVYGRCTDQFSNAGYGVVGTAAGGGSWAIYAFGSMGASGTKPFRIDHPFDPENKYLLHYAAESPTPQNFYVGNIRTDAKGYAWVDLPDYFSEINTNFKYQLTVISEDFVQAVVSKKIAGNRFQVRTSAPNTEVSWRVDADRNDLYVRNRPPKDVVDKVGREKGAYQHPEFYGLGPERGMNYHEAPTKPIINPRK